MNKTSREKEAVLSVFAALVRPLMRFAFEYGITASEIAGAVRRTYLQTLEARLREQKRPTTDARLAAVAGLPRSDVTALRGALHRGDPHSSRTAVNLDQLTSVLTAWHTHSNFSGAYGLAMDVDIAPVPGSPRRTFAELVSIACPGCDPEVMLDELLAAGCVEIVDHTTARCVSRTYVPSTANVTRIERMGRFLGAVSASFTHNLFRADTEPLFFERTVVSDDALSSSARDRFLALAGEKGQELLAELDTFLAQLGASERNSAGKRYGVGVYFFEDDATDPIPNHHAEKSNDLRIADKSSAVEVIDVLAAPRRKE